MSMPFLKQFCSQGHLTSTNGRSVTGYKATWFMWLRHSLSDVYWCVRNSFRRCWSLWNALYWSPYPDMDFRKYSEITRQSSPSVIYPSLVCFLPAARYTRRPVRSDLLILDRRFSVSQSHLMPSWINSRNPSSLRTVKDLIIYNSFGIFSSYI
jgi:hypothetical protein